VTGADGVTRCWWAASAPDYRAYHDTEWGFPVDDDARLFEKLCLEGFQAGLSWLTILRKREAFRKAFRGFDPRLVARFDGRRIDRLLADPDIVRHRGKIQSTVDNAGHALELIDELGSLASFFWQFEPAPGSRPRRITHRVLRSMSTSAESTALARELKRRGWTFVGPTTVYAFMQAMGLVNDHLEGCAIREDVEHARSTFARPGAVRRV